MLRLLLYILLLPTTLNCFAQFNITANPSLGNYTSCPAPAVNISCGSTPHIGSIIKLRVFQISGNQITFMLAKCDNSQFSTSGTAYLRAATACGSTITSTTYNVNTSFITMSVTVNNPGTVNIVGVTQATTGGVYYTEPITLTISNNYTISVTNPTGAFPYTTGQSLPIGWSATGLSSSDNIQFELYYVGSNSLATVLYPGTGISNSGFTYWTIPSNITSGQYYLKAYKFGCSGSCPFGTSANFTINQALPGITVVAPNGGQGYSTGNNVYINWSYTNLTGNVQIELVDNNTPVAGGVNPIGSPGIGEPVTNLALNWTIPASVPTGQYKIKIYSLQNTAISDLSDATFNITQTLPSITVSSPVLNQSLFCGTSFNIQWSSSNISPSANIAIEVVDAFSNTPLNIVTNGTSNTGSYIWNIPSGISLATGTYKLKIYQVGSGSPVGYSSTFSFNCTQCVSWQGAPPSDTETVNAVNYLCSQGIVQNAQSQQQNIYSIKREQLAKITYIGLLGINAVTPADSFTSMYYDLQDPNLYYYKYAKALSYLEYGDGIPPFSRAFSHFRPSDSITRKDAMKVFVEAWNLPLAYGGTSPFTDITVSDPMYPWIKTMYNYGLITGTNGLFNPTNDPTEKLTRNQAFIILYRMLTQLNKPTPQNSDYYRPLNMTPKNSNRILSLDEGSFSNYTKTSFSVNGLMPLVFEHNYNSFVTDINDEYFVRSTVLNGMVYDQNSLAKGWSHNYNTYIVALFGDTNTTNTDDRIVVHWGSGTIELYKIPSATGQSYIPEAPGNYNDLKVLNGQFVLTTKDQMKYYFQPLVVSNQSFVATLEKIKDRNNNEIQLTYSLNGNVPRLATVTDPSGRTLQFGYSNSTFPNRITSVTATTGSVTRTISFNYNTAGNLTTYTDPKGQTTTYVYNTNPADQYLLTQIILPKGNIISNTYQNRKLISSEISNSLAVSINPAISYNNGIATSSATTSVTRNGQIHSYNQQRNQYGRLTSLSGSGTNVTAQYLDVNNPTLPTNITNQTTNIPINATYDNKGNLLTATTSASGLTISENFTYNSMNDIITHTDGNGNTTTMGYNTSGNLTSIQQLIGTTSISYNTNGTIASLTNPSGITTTYGYNIYGNITNTSLAGLITGTALYDGASRLISSTDPKGATTTYSYDANDNRLNDNFDPSGMGINTLYSFDPNDNLSSVTNALGGVTSLIYNNQDELIQQSFGGFNKLFEYNEDGSLKKHTSQNGVVFNYTYNTDGLLTNDGYATYSYNSDKTLQSVTANGKALAYTYDPLKRVIAVNYNDFPGNTVSYQYDNNNNITQITYPGGFTAKYTYDGNNRLINVKDGNNNVLVSYAYHTDGRLQQQTNANGTETHYTYDAAGRMTGINNVDGNNGTIASYTFTPDNNGNHTTEVETVPGALAMPQLSNMMLSGTYSNNRVQQYGGISHTDDGNGNNLSAGTQYAYTWDIRDNLTTYTNSAVSTAYEYDGTEARRRRNNTRFVLDPLNNNNVLMETDLSGNPLALYIHGMGLVCRITTGTNARHYYHYDYRGSTVAITNDVQSVTHRYRYGAFGENYGEQETGFSNPFRYVGKYGVMYEDSALYYMRARYYNPKLGRFLGEDPVWATNLFAYCDNNPVISIDPNGTFSVGVKNGKLVIKRSWFEKAFGVAKKAKETYEKVKKAIEIYNDANTVLNGMGYTREDKIDYLQNLLVISDKYVGKYVTPKLLGILANDTTLRGLRLAASIEDSIDYYLETDDLDAALEQINIRAKELGFQ